MPANLEHSAVATGLEKISFHSNPKERECQRMFKLLHKLHSFHLLARWCSNPLSYSSIIHESIISRCTNLVWKRQRNQRSNCQHSLDWQKSKRIPEKHLLLFYWICQRLWLCGSQQTVKNSEREGNTRPPDLPLEKSVCSSRSNS